ncbi:ATP-binding protein [Microvirga sp. 2TAF3]|uniref:ATP-binding protein n=1 Tax=Microvirga sp. 2TAF3 TaxID=3233014 RepID=UPI003F9525C6
MAELQPRALHLHTLDSLIADLVSGRAVLVGDKEYRLPDDATRSTLQWYHEVGVKGWPANVSLTSGEQLADAALKTPPELPPLQARPANANTRRLLLKRLEAHRFAGLHKFGTPAAAPENYIHDFSASLTLFEGRNGSGKTSLANAIIWALTGELLRPQRLPEKTEQNFPCWVDPINDGSPSIHQLTPVTPMPDVADFRPSDEWVPADTWVELTFEDENGNTIPIRRTHIRTSRGKPVETCDLSALGIDPIGTRIGTLMPGLLGFIKVGSESELGRAVSQLTGLSALVDLAGHARRAKDKIDKDYRKAKIQERDRIDQAYNTIKNDLERALADRPDLKPSADIPPPSDDATIEITLEAIKQHFNDLKSSAFGSVKEILCAEFDPTDSQSKANLEKSIGPALSELAQLARLTPLARLNSLRTLTSDQLKSVDGKIANLQQEARTLAALAKTPDAAARTRLYARIASWIADHPDPNLNLDICIVCGGPLIDVVDDVTGKAVKIHIEEAKVEAKLLSQSLAQWSQAALNELSAGLPEALQREIKIDLPPHPCDLLRAALIDELFEHPSFSGVLSPLKEETAKAFDAAVMHKSALADETLIDLPSEFSELELTLRRVDRALRFARWRQANEPLARTIVETVIGRPAKDNEAVEKKTLIGKLLELEATVKAAKPLTDALDLCHRLDNQLVQRRTVEKRLETYSISSAALGNLLKLGDLADLQVNELQEKLGTSTATWRKKIYTGAFPTIAHELVGTSLGRDGELGLRMRSGGVTAPAQHITNASALRASLVAFYLAFWEYVMAERGGLNLILFDDPQELLDDENREYLATALCSLPKIGAQVVLTSYDSRFSSCVAKATGIGGVAHFEVQPATRKHPTLRTIPPRSEIIKRKAAYDEDRDAEVPARDYTDACRVFLESKLGDIFEDPAFSTWVKENPHPALASYVSRLRSQVAAAGPQSMFGIRIFKQFVDHPALQDKSNTIELMNKSHHGKRHEIRAGDVALCTDDLDSLVKHAEEMWDECRRWRRRDPSTRDPVPSPTPLEPIQAPNLKITICPDLAAFTEHSSSEESQEEIQPLDPKAFEGKATFYLRRDNFGFAAPEGSIAIVEAEPTAVDDRRLVVARHENKILARRFLRSTNSELIGLTAETLDPRTRTPKTIFLREDEVALHRVTGIIFDHDLTVDRGSDEAVSVDASKIFQSIKVAYRVIDESAVPLALPKQVVLGGAQIQLDTLDSYHGRLAALQLKDGLGIFKRIGSTLPGELNHIRQFESIGGLGSSQVLSIGKPQVGLQELVSARLILGVLYHG